MAHGRAVACACALALSLHPYRASGAETLHVLDCKSQSILAVDPETGSILRESRLPATPDRALVSPDGRRLVVLNRVDASQGFGFGYPMRAPSSISVVDLESLSASAPIELGWGIPDMQLGRKTIGFRPRWGTEGIRISRSGSHLYALMPGHKEHPAQLAVVDLGAAKLAGALPLDREGGRILAGEGGRAVLFFEAHKPKKGSPVLPELRLFEPGWAQPKVLALDREPASIVASTDRSRVYVLDHGGPSGGRLRAVSALDLAIESTLDLPGPARAVVLDVEGERQLVLGSHEVYVVDGARTIATLPTGKPPILVRRTPKLLLVGTPGSLLGFEAGSFHTAGEVAIKGRVERLAIAPDGRRAFALTRESPEAFGLLHVVDLESWNLVATAQTGNSGKVEIEAAMLYAQQRMLQPWTGLAPMRQLDPRNDPSLFVEPEGKSVFVFNSKSSDFTVVDAASGKVLKTVGMGRETPRMVGGGEILVGSGDRRVHVLETATLKTRTISFGMSGLFEAIEVSPSSARVAVVATDEVTVIDGKTGQEISKVRDVKPCGAAFTAR